MTFTMEEQNGSIHGNTPTQLGAVLDIHLGIDCPILDTDGSIEDVRQSSSGNICNIDIIVEDEDSKNGKRIEHQTTEIEDGCVCPVFSMYGSVPHIENGGDGSLRIQTYVSDREILTTIIGSLTEITESVRLVRLTEMDAGPDDYVTINRSSLTTTQRETVQAAVDAGYYASPRETSLDELATQLGISKSAASQRLNAAESNLLTELFAT